MQTGLWRLRATLAKKNDTKTTLGNSGCEESWIPVRRHRINYCIKAELLNVEQITPQRALWDDESVIELITRLLDDVMETGLVGEVELQYV